MGLLYRISQKINYHFASNIFKKNIAEINRFEKIINLKKDETFSIKDCNLTFTKKHNFVLERFELFKSLSSQENSGFSIKDNNLIYKINNLNLIVTTSEELFIINEVFIETCYELITNKPVVAIDIGMNVGYTSLFLSSKTNIEEIFSFEPFKDTFKDAENNFELNSEYQKKITRYNYGLGLKNEEIELGYSQKHKGKNSILGTDSNFPKESVLIKNGYDTVKKITVSALNKDFIIKMDCEGAEFDIFKSFEDKKIPENIIAFIIEWHKEDPKPIIDKLLQNNFIIQKRSYGNIGILTAMKK